MLKPHHHLLETTSYYCELTYQGSYWVGDIYFSHGQQSDNVAHAALVPTLLHGSVLILIAS